ncbi:prefoldin subunit 5-like [Corticium candelabrum]|uniref:prefoldin subunit 5-like n=1 Tax=Corticium candelabrum TaxID=121492 RepID=UPI002E259152|nr:prefoldin subunit 5-like [Corticium candelabrum]
MSEVRMQEIDLSQVSMSQLSHLKTQIEQEVQFLSTSLHQLKAVQQKFAASKDILSKLVPENDGKEALIPLTSSLYVPGRLSETNRVLLDIGTGYYTEMSVDDAKSYFQRKVDYLVKQIEGIQPTMKEKQKTRDMVLSVLQSKMQQLTAQVRGQSS